MDSININNNMDFSSINNKIDNKDIKDGKIQTDELPNEIPLKSSKSSKSSNASKTSNIKICEGIKKDGEQCNKKGIELNNEKYYCKVHLKQVINTSNIKICEGIKKDGEQCNKKGTELNNEKYYCKVHLKQVINASNIKICEGIKKDGEQCNKKGTELNNEKYYCKVHLKQVIKPIPKVTPKTTPINKNDNLEGKKLEDEIKNFIETRTKYFYTHDEYKSIKSLYKKIIIKIHPDKCKINTIDIDGLTKKLTSYINNIDNIYQKSYDYKLDN